MLSDGDRPRPTSGEDASEPSEQWMRLQELMQLLQGAISSPEMSRDRFLPFFSQELHRAGLCCNGHVHQKTCQDSTQSRKPRSSRSVRQMRTPAVYRLSHQSSNMKQSARSAPTDSPDALTQQRPVKPSSLPLGSLREYTKSGRGQSAGTVVQITGTSHLLNAEKLRLRHGLSRSELASILTMAETMFKPTCAQATLPEIAKGMEDMKRWEEAVRMSSEHMALRPVVKCRQRRKRDSETKVAIQGLHPEIETKLREGYLKAVRRLEAFQKATSLPFPPNCGAFLEWTLKVKEREFKAFIELLTRVYPRIIMLLRQRREGARLNPTDTGAEISLHTSCEQSSDADHDNGCDIDESNEDDIHDGDQAALRTARIPALISEMSERMVVARDEMQRYVSEVREDEEKYRELGGRLLRSTSDASDVTLVDALFGLIPTLLDRVDASNTVEDQNIHQSEVLSGEGLKTSVFRAATTWPPTMLPVTCNSNKHEASLSFRSSVRPFWTEGRWQVAIWRPDGARVLIDPWGVDGSSDLHSMFASLEHTVTRCACLDGSKTECPSRSSRNQEVLLPLRLPKAIKKQFYTKQHSVAVAWWATVEVLYDKVDKTKQLREINRLDWVRQEGIMAEALCSLRPDVVDHVARKDHEEARQPTFQSFQSS